MGKIFNISDNPVSTIGNVIKLQVNKLPNRTEILLPKNLNTVDKFVSVEKQAKSNFFIKMRNGIGRLMPHFSKKLTKK